MTSAHIDGPDGAGKMEPVTDYSDLGFPGKPEEGWPIDPYDEDGDCDFCFNGHWKHHAPWCQWADARDAGEIPGARPDLNDGPEERRCPHCGTLVEVGFVAADSHSCPALIDGRPSPEEGA